MTNYKMYMITGANKLYFLWAALPEKEIRLHIKDDETMEECAPERHILSDMADSRSTSFIRALTASVVCLMLRRQQLTKDNSELTTISSRNVLTFKGEN